MAFTRRAVKAFFLVCILNICAGAPRVKRQTYGFTIISNVSLPCETVSSSQYADLPMVELTDEQKMELLLQYGGEFLPRQMATTLNGATRLPSPIAIEGRIQDQIKASKTSSGTSTLTKQDIVDYMMNHVYNGLPIKETAEDSTTDKKGKAKKAQPVTQRESFRDVCSEMQDQNDSQKRRIKWRDWIDVSDVTKGFPFMFPEMLGLPKTVTYSDDSVGTQEFCLIRGDSTADLAHVRLCTVCSTVRDFGTSMWPQFVSEAACSVGDNGCLFTDGLPNGSCQPVIMQLTMLQKHPQECVLVLSGGEQVIAYEWLVVNRDINVGCECNVMENSYFTMFV